MATLETDLPLPSSTMPPACRRHPLSQLMRYSFTPFKFLEECAQMGETFSIRLAGFPKMVHFTRPEDIREIFHADPTVLHSGEGNKLLSVLVGNTSVLVLDEEPHVRQRRVLIPPLKGERMRTFFDAMQSETLAIAKQWASGGVVRADTATQTITLRVILRATFGEVGASFQELQYGMSRLLMQGRHPLILVMWKLFPPEKHRDSNFLKYFKLLREFDAVLYRVIAEQRKVPATERPACVLSDLFAMTHEDGSGMSDVEIRDAIITILAAGHDTTALSLAWALEQIVPRADVVAKIHAELKEVFGDALPQPDHIQRLEYLDAVVRESLRVRNILPFVVRLVKSPITINGVTYPPGVVLCPAIHLLHQREDLYPKPREFHPERFLQRKYGPHEWTPFGGGNRACLGQTFALYEMKVVLATLFTELSLQRPPGAVSKQVRRGIAVAPHDGTCLIATKR